LCWISLPVDGPSRRVHDPARCSGVMRAGGARAPGAQTPRRHRQGEGDREADPKASSVMPKDVQRERLSSGPQSGLWAARRIVGKENGASLG